MTSFAKFFSFLLLIGALLFIYGVSAFNSTIYDETEGQYAGAVREMRERDNVLIPTNNGLPRLQKPPLTYWTMIASSAIIPNQDAAVRLPFVIAVILWSLLIYKWASDFLPGPLPLFAGVLSGFGFGPAIFGRMIMPEIFLTLSVTFSLYAVFKAITQSQLAQRWWLLFWISVSIGSLFKGLHAAVWPLLIIGILFGMESRNRVPWRGLWHPAGIMLFLCTQLSWYGYIESQFPGFIRDNIINEQMGHALDFRDPPTYVRVSLSSFILGHAFLLFPGLWLLPSALKYWRAQTPESNAYWMFRLLLIWIAVVLLTSCFSARQDYYTMSMWGAIALLAAPSLQSTTPSERKWFYGMLILMTLSGLCLLGASMWNPIESGKSVSFRANANDDLIGVLTQLQPESLKKLSFALLCSGSTLALGGMLAIWFYFKKIPLACALSFLIAMSGPIQGCINGFESLSEYFSLKNTAVALSSKSNNSLIVYDGPMNLASSLLYYQNRPITLVRANPNAEFAVRVLGMGKEKYITSEQLSQKWSTLTPIYLITHKNEVNFWKHQLTGSWNLMELARSGDRLVISNQPQ